jgi:peptidoglycan hydrolase-like protein with peptidoglycan-binding domain
VPLFRRANTMKTPAVVLLSSLLWLGPLMVGAEDASPSRPQPPAQGELLSSGDILIVQQRLDAFNDNPGPIDGIWHPQTTEALRAFQAQHGLPVTGELDEATRKELQLPRTF